MSEDSKISVVEQEFAPKSTREWLALHGYKFKTYKTMKAAIEEYLEDLGDDDDAMDIGRTDGDTGKRGKEGKNIQERRQTSPLATQRIWDHCLGERQQGPCKKKRKTRRRQRRRRKRRSRRRERRRGMFQLAASAGNWLLLQLPASGCLLQQLSC